MSAPLISVNYISVIDKSQPALSHFIVMHSMCVFVYEFENASSMQEEMSDFNYRGDRKTECTNT